MAPRVGFRFEMLLPAKRCEVLERRAIISACSLMGIALRHSAGTLSLGDKDRSMLDWRAKRTEGGSYIRVVTIPPDRGRVSKLEL